MLTILAPKTVLVNNLFIQPFCQKREVLTEEVVEPITVICYEINAKKEKTLADLIDFHYRFECIHPFQDGSGRVGRLILFKECLRNNIVPFIIDEELKLFYYRGLSKWKSERSFLMDTCLTLNVTGRIQYKKTDKYGLLLLAINQAIINKVEAAKHCFHLVIQFPASGRELLCVSIICQKY